MMTAPTVPTAANAVPMAVIQSVVVSTGGTLEAYGGLRTLRAKWASLGRYRRLEQVDIAWAALRPFPHLIDNRPPILEKARTLPAKLSLNQGQEPPTTGLARQGVEDARLRGA